MRIKNLENLKQTKNSDLILLKIYRDIPSLDPVKSTISTIHERLKFIKPKE